MSSQHTPTPWALTKLKDEAHDVVSVNIVAVSTTEQGVETVVFDCEGSFGIREADAAFIVRAANAHHDLLAMLKAVRERCPGIHHTDQQTGEPFADSIDVLLERIGE